MGNSNSKSLQKIDVFFGTDFVHEITSLLENKNSKNNNNYGVQCEGIIVGSDKEITRGMDLEVKKFILLIAVGTNISPRAFCALFLDVVGRKATLQELNVFIYDRKNKTGRLDDGEKDEDEEVNVFISNCANENSELCYPFTMMSFHRVFFCAVGRKETLQEMNSFVSQCSEGAHVKAVVACKNKDKGKSKIRNDYGREKSKKEEVKGGNEQEDEGIKDGRIKMKNATEVAKAVIEKNESVCLEEVEEGNGRAKIPQLGPAEFCVCFLDLMRRKATLPEMNRYLSILAGVRLYDVANGLVGLRRDIVLRLCELMLENAGRIRTVMAVCVENYNYKKHLYFIDGREKSRWLRSSSFWRNPEGGYSLAMHPRHRNTRVHTHSRAHKQLLPFPTPNCVLRCVFHTANGHFRTLVMKTVVWKGIFRWTVQIDYGVGNDSDLVVGICEAKKDYQYIDCAHLGQRYIIVESCALVLARRLKSGLSSELHITHNDGPFAVPTVAPAMSLVSVEVDMSNRSVCFFINRQRVPAMVTQILPSVNFAASGRFYASFTSVCFTRLSRPTPTLTPVHTVLKYDFVKK